MCCVTREIKNQYISHLKPNIMKSNTYHNSTNQSKEFVKTEVKKFNRQEDEVFVIMSRFKKATASDVWNRFGTGRVPITSIRRALSNLTHEGELHKTKSTKIGLYGKPEHYYELFDLDKLF